MTRETEPGAPAAADPTAAARAHASPDDAAHATEPAPRARAWLRWLMVLLLACGVTWLFLWKPAGTPTKGPRTPAARGPMPVQVATVARGDLANPVRYPGELAADTAEIAASVAGQLVSVSVRLGDQVTATQELARIDETDWQRQLDEAKAQVKFADATRRRAVAELSGSRKELVRTRKLLKGHLVSAQTLETLEARVAALQAGVAAARAQREQATARVAILTRRLDECRIVAPYAGRVVDRLRDPGGYVQAGVGIVRLVADGTLRVRFEVPEVDARQFAPGTGFQVLAPETPDRSDGTVTGVAAEVDRQRRIVRVQGTLARLPDGWRSGMYVEVEAGQTAITGALVLPGVAVVTRLTDQGGETHGVFRSVDGAARWTEVRVLGRDGDRVAVAGALSPGDAVLVAGHESLADGAAIRVVVPAQKAP